MKYRYVVTVTVTHDTEPEARAYLRRAVAPLRTYTEPPGRVTALNVAIVKPERKPCNAKP